MGARADPLLHCLALLLVRLELPVSARRAIDVDLHAFLVEVRLPAATLLGLSDALDALEEEHDLLVWNFPAHATSRIHNPERTSQDRVALARAIQRTFAPNCDRN